MHGCKKKHAAQHIRNFQPTPSTRTTSCPNLIKAQDRSRKGLAKSSPVNVDLLSFAFLLNLRVIPGAW